ncbi:MAG: hypothetical protein P9E67_01905, partial [Candidatus Competibacter sp.]|nr:hypothetical protein [Candidatus Competibacter sp.]
SHADLDSAAWHLGEAKAILGDRLIAPPAAPSATSETAAAADEAAVPETAPVQPPIAVPTEPDPSSIEATETTGPK